MPHEEPRQSEPRLKGGHVPISREVIEYELQNGDSQSTLLLIYLIVTAAIHEHTALTSAGEVTLARGETIASTLYLAKKLGLTRSKVRRCFNRWERQGFISRRAHGDHEAATRPTTGTATPPTILRLCHYETWAALPKRSDHGRGHGSEQLPLETDHTKEEEKREDRKKGIRARKALPDNSPSAKDLAWAAAQHPEVDAQSEAEPFRNHHLSRGSLMADWSAAWRTWIHNAEKFRRQHDRTNGRRTGPQRSSGGVQRSTQSRFRADVVRTEADLLTFKAV